MRTRPCCRLFLALLLLQGLPPPAQAAPSTPAKPAEGKADAGAPVYIIGVGDQIGVLVWDQPNLSRSGMLVRPDGRISLPLVGDTQAAGLSAPALAVSVTESLRALELVNQPRVTVIVEAINSYRIYVIGHVLKPGVYTFQSPTRLVEVLATAGGFDQYADTGRIVVLTSRNSGAQTRIEVDYKKIVSGARLEDNLFLQPGDTVIVP